MRAWVCHHLSEDRSGLRFEPDWPDAPPPGPDEVTVRLTAAALNYPDLLMLSGGYQYKPELPFVPAFEGCGVIEAVGEALSGELIGQRVIVGARSGCLAEHITLPASGVRTAPERLHDDAAAAHTIGGLTAWVGLVVRGRLQAGERVLVLGAGGGMGLAAVSLAAAQGAEVIAAASSEAKLAAAKAAGAAVLLRTERDAPDFAAAGAVDVVFDAVGGAAVMPVLKTLRWGGRYLVIGFVGGIASVPLNRLLLRGIEIVGVRAGEAGRVDPAAGAAHVAAIDALAEAGRLAPHIGLRVPLEQADTAFAAMADGSLTGKAVVLIDPAAAGPSPDPL